MIPNAQKVASAWMNALDNPTPSVLAWTSRLLSTVGALQEVLSVVKGISDRNVEAGCPMSAMSGEGLQVRYTLGENDVHVPCEFSITLDGVPVVLHPMAEGHFGTCGSPGHEQPYGCDHLLVGISYVENWLQRTLTDMVRGLETSLVAYEASMKAVDGGDMPKAMVVKLAKANVPGLRQQTQFTCMAASMAACLQAHGKPFSEDDVNKVMNASALRGASWEDALVTLQYFGLRGILIIPATLGMVKEATDKGHPVLIGWNPEGRPWSHASVVSDVSGDMTTVTVMDPNCPEPDRTFREVPAEEFYRKWGEPMGDQFIIRRPALVVEREVTTDGKQVRASLTNPLSLPQFARSLRA